MFKVISLTRIPKILNKTHLHFYKGVCLRTFLSQAYYCQEIWDGRLNSPVLKKVNLGELYHDLDQRFQKTRQISAVDVDVFANVVDDESFTDELLDILHKLRLSAETCNTLNSTSHAAIRVLLKHGKFKDLVNALDDRLNYGLFLDYYTANILLDSFWKAKEYAFGAIVASQLMLQEEHDHLLSRNLSLLHCYSYLLNPEGWPEQALPEEPEEEVKIRVKYLRNPYDDDHFDLREPSKIVGKTLVNITKHGEGSLNKSFNIVGLVLYGKLEAAIVALNECKNKNISLYSEILDLLPKDNDFKDMLEEIQTESADILNLLKINVEKAERETSEQDIAEQCKVYNRWNTERIQALEEQQKRLSEAKRLKNIEELKKVIKEKETKLWFFENEEKIELAIEAKKVFYPKRWFGKKKKPKQIDEGYIPPEVQVKQTHPKY